MRPSDRNQGKATGQRQIFLAYTATPVSNRGLGRSALPIEIAAQGRDGVARTHSNRYEHEDLKHV